jgi:hypothetical protein
MAEAKPILFIHGLFQGPFKPGGSQFLLPNPVSIPDLPGYVTNRPASPDDISVGAAADFIYAYIHELGYVRLTSSDTQSVEQSQSLSQVVIPRPTNCATRLLKSYYLNECVKVP